MDETLEEGLVRILDNRDQVLRHKTMRLEAMWECEDTVRATYLFLFRDKGTWFSCLVIK